MKILNEELSLDEANAVEIAGLWPDFVTWEETPFRPSDDIVLLSFGFHFSSDGTTLYRDDGWLVDCSKPIPVWFHNGKKMGGMSYDDVVNLFSKEKAA